MRKFHKHQKSKWRKKTIFGNFQQVRVLSLTNCFNNLRSFQYLHFNEFCNYQYQIHSKKNGSNKPKEPSSRSIPQTKLPTLKSVSLLHPIFLFSPFPISSSVQGLATSRVDSFSESTFITLIFIPCLRPRTTCWR